MKKFTTTMFAALIGLALTMPAMAQNTQTAPAKTTQGDTSKDKKSSTPKKNSKKKSSKKNTTDSSTTTPPKK